MEYKKPPSNHPLLVFSLLSILYIFSMFYRLSNAVIAPNLVRDLGLDAKTLGHLGGAFFYSFALVQIPMGPMLDRIGPRMIITSLCFIGGLGSFLFAYGGSFTAALWGRILLGIGMASVLMGSLKVFTVQFPPERFTTLMGILISVGNLGGFLGASPLAYLTSTIGWRMTFALAGVVTLLLAILLFWMLGGATARPDRSASSKPVMGVIHVIRLVLGSLDFWKIGILTFFRYGTLVGLQGLWLGPYLMEIHGYPPIQAGNILILLSIGTIIGYPIAGQLFDRTSYPKKRITLLGLSIYSLGLIPLTGVLKIESPFWYSVIFFFIGFFSSFGMGLYSHVKELFPINISGTVLTWANFFTMAGVAVIMPVMGRVIESFPRSGRSYPAEAYHFAFLLNLLGMVLSLIFYALPSKER